MSPADINGPVKGLADSPFQGSCRQPWLPALPGWQHYFPPVLCYHSLNEIFMDSFIKWFLWLISRVQIGGFATVFQILCDIVQFCSLLFKLLFVCPKNLRWFQAQFLWNMFMITALTIPMFPVHMYFFLTAKELVKHNGKVLCQAHYYEELKLNHHKFTVHDNDWCTVMYGNMITVALCNIRIEVN